MIPERECSADNNWDFWTNLPEALHQVIVVMRDRGIPRSFRHMHGFGSHTYSFVNAKNERFWMKFTFKTLQGIEYFTDAEATELIGRDRESHQRDLFESIEKGEFPRWKLYVQIMKEEDANTYHIHPLDLTKVWAHGDCPPIEVGIFELNRNPDNFFAETEQAPFSPANIVPGISFSGQGAPRTIVLLRRRATVWPGRQPPPDSRQCAEVPVSQLPSRRGYASRWEQRGSYQL